MHREGLLLFFLILHVAIVFDFFGASMVLFQVIIFFFANTYFIRTSCSPSFFSHSYFEACRTWVCYFRLFYSGLNVVFSYQHWVSSWFYAFWLFLYFAEFFVQSPSHHLSFRFYNFHLLIVFSLTYFIIVPSLSLIYLQFLMQINLCKTGWRFWAYHFRFLFHQWFMFV